MPKEAKYPVCSRRDLAADSSVYGLRAATSEGVFVNYALLRYQVDCL